MGGCPTTGWTIQVLTTVENTGGPERPPVAHDCKDVFNRGCVQFSLYLDQQLVCNQVLVKGRFQRPLNRR